MTYGINPYTSQQISIKKIYIGTAAEIFPNPYVFTLQMLKPRNALLSISICFQASLRKSRAGRSCITWDSIIT
jgi:hypothetical protein